MSSGGAPARLKETERVQAAAPTPMPGRGPLGGGMVGQKASRFGPSANVTRRTSSSGSPF